MLAQFNKCAVLLATVGCMTWFIHFD